MGYRRFSAYFFIILVGFTGINALIWFSWTKEITDPRRNAGDLLRIGYILGHVSKHQNVDELPKHHINTNQYNRQQVDMVTVGDSFSNGGGGSHYQDYIASFQGLTVLNVPADVFLDGSDPLSTVSKLINSGYLDIIKPKYLLLESVERLSVQRLTNYFSLQPTTTIEEIERSFHTSRPEEKLAKNINSNVTFINNGNWKFIVNNIQYLFIEKASGSKVIISKLNRRFFSDGQGDNLIFHDEDIKTCKLTTPDSIAETNRNLNRLGAVLKSKGITLVFMPVVNKLNLYEPYLRQHRYPKSDFFEQLRKLPKDYLFIDTKEILVRTLENNELDIFHQDDSHWTWKASKAIFATIRISELSHARE